MRVKSREVTTYTNTVSLANALNDPDVYDALQVAIDEGNLLDDYFNTKTGGVQGDGSIDPTTGGCKLYLFDHVNQIVQEVELSDDILTPGQCSETYRISTLWDHAISPGGNLNAPPPPPGYALALGPITNITTNIQFVSGTQHRGRTFYDDGNLNCFFSWQ